MFWTSYFLAVLAIALAWPVPVLLSRASWPSRAPVTAMLLWQAVGLAGGLSMIGAMLAYGLEPLGDDLLAGLSALAGMVLHNAPTTSLGFWHIFALSAAALLSAHLVFTLLLTYLRIQRQRRRHRILLDLLASPSPDGARTMVINVDSPVAYCLPGGARSVTVLSDGLMAALEPDELRAVLSHENAHLSQRHDLLLWVFAAWRQALPWLPTTRLAQESVNALIEMLADDAALKAESKATLIRAIAIVAGGSPAPSEARLTFGAGPETALAGSGPAQPGATGGTGSSRATGARVSRLLSPQPPLTEAARAAVLVGCVALLAMPTALLIVPGLLG